MLTVKEAFRAAENWVRDLYSEADLRYLHLEEVEFADAGVWRITLGWAEPALSENTLTGVLQAGGYALPRVYKTIAVDADNGQVMSMKIREVTR